jgi:DNA-binding MarR family transcriptional regulator
LAKTRSPSRTIESEKEITLDLLNALHDNRAHTQRSLAEELGIALGLANAYLKRCAKKGLIKVQQAPANRYAYYLTPKGFAEKSSLTAEYFSQSFKFFRLARTESGELLKRCEARGWRRVALYGAGDLAEIVTLCARDTAVEPCCVVDAAVHDAEFAGLPVIGDLDRASSVDAVIVCSLTDPQTAYDTLRLRFPAERVLAHRFLKVSPNGDDNSKPRR